MNAPTAAPKAQFKQRVFSGIQPSGSPHLGNDLGAIVKFVELLKSHECIYCGGISEGNKVVIVPCS